jgi:hypothetical protein
MRGQTNECRYISAPHISAADVRPSLGLEFRRVRWENPIMTVKADSKNRVRLTAARPGDVFQVEVSAGGIITLVRLAPAEPKLVKPRKVNGRLMGAKEARPNRQAIVDAIRMDREAR